MVLTQLGENVARFCCCFNAKSSGVRKFVWNRFFIFLKFEYG